MHNDTILPTVRLASFIVVATMMLLAACASPIKQAEEYGAQDEWMKAVIEYRKAYAQHRRDGWCCFSQRKSRLQSLGYGNNFYTLHKSRAE